MFLVERVSQGTCPSELLVDFSGRCRVSIGGTDPMDWKPVGFETGFEGTDQSEEGLRHVSRACVGRERQDRDDGPNGRRTEDPP